MAKQMTDIEVDAFKDALATLTSRGDEAAVREHIDTFFPRLPEAMQNEIVSGLFYTAQQQEAADLEKQASE